MLNLSGLDRWGPSVARLLFIVALVFAALPSGLVWRYQMNPDMLEGSWVNRLQWTSLFAIAALFAWRMPRAVVKAHLAFNPFLVVLALYCLASVLWSDVPGVVIKRTVQFYGVVLIGMVVAYHWNARLHQLLAVTMNFFGIILLLSVLYAVFDPDIGRESVAGIVGSWRGILDQKNALGIFSGVCVLLFVVVQTTNPISPVLAWIGGLLGMVCLVMSRSSSSMVFTLASVVCYFFFMRDYIRAPSFLTRVALASALGAAVVYQLYFFANGNFPDVADLLGPLAAFFGKSTDLTGRADIWDLVWLSVNAHQPIGVGFASFWLGPGGPSQYISDSLRWNVPSAHNGYLEVLNELGYFGLVLFVGMLLVHLRGIFKLFVLDRVKFAFHLALLMVFVISNFSESTALRVLTFLQVLMFFSMMLVQQSVIERRMPTAP